MTENEAIASTRIEVVDYPWHVPLRRRLLARGRERLPHALLFHGQPGLGKLAFALGLGRDLLCLTPVEEAQGGVRRACGTCQSCRLFEAGTHPDWLWVAPEEEGKQITVDQIRAVMAFLGLRPHTAGRQVVLIAPAEAMNVHAANSLLKVLEEPTPESYFLLVSHQPSRLLPTVRSRCQDAASLPPPTAEVLPWLARATGLEAAQAAELLAMTEGAPLAALAYAREGLAKHQTALRATLEALAAGQADPVASAARFVPLGVPRVLDWLYLLAAEWIRQSYRGSRGGEKNMFNINKLLHFLDYISDMKKDFPGPLDDTLALENLFIEWSRIHASRD